MVRYIDAEDFAAEVRKISKSPLNEWDTWGVLSALERIPTADVAPVVHARWVDNGEPYCSRCEWSPAPEWPCIEDLQLADVYYCPHCGARMDEVTK